jgi:hypothetical protein
MHSTTPLKLRHGACVLALLVLAGCSKGGVDRPSASGVVPDRGTEAATTPASTTDASDAASVAGNEATPSPTATRLPGLAGRNVRASASGRYQPVPADIAEFLLSLPAGDLGVPRQVLQQVLRAKAFVVEIPHADGAPDLRVTLTNDPGHGYWLWLRSFRGGNADVVHYLVQFSLRCDMRTDATAAEQARALQGACAQPAGPAIDTGLLAYRVAAGGVPGNVTASIANPATLLGADAMARYQSMGGGDPYVDDSRLDEVPVFRWVMEFDPEQPLPASDPRAFDHGSYVHAGFVAWTGDGFASSDTVPRSQWPCPQHSPSLCADDDRFVGDGK